MKIVCSVA
ncbi:similar to DKFZP564P1916 protein (predicted), isoform CRA_a [Rattus norvegicus]|uniref:Similar to DKFZP564P1916 protein (Predicted), isoform CRA_a n=1 Tax=Rattus norvegicus TaxID=10116 RepID=A6JH77_RAT|nr:similar to DKFZP564P1916 protein (predicted), isoform CRA_a [Rattus norvegicus]